MFDYDRTKYTIQCLASIGDPNLILDWGAFGVLFHQMKQIVSLEVGVFG